MARRRSKAAFRGRVAPRRPARTRRAQPPPRHRPGPIVRQQPDVTSATIDQRQATAQGRAQRYVPLQRQPADQAPDILPGGLASVNVGDVNIGESLRGLQTTAQTILDVATDVLGIQSPAYSGGVDAREAAFVYGTDRSTGAGILDAQQRLADVEGTLGTAQKFIGGEYVTVGGRGRGGPGWTEALDVE